MTAKKRWVRRLAGGLLGLITAGVLLTPLAATQPVTQPGDPARDEFVAAVLSQEEIDRIQAELRAIEQQPKTQSEILHEKVKNALQAEAAMQLSVEDHYAGHYVDDEEVVHLYWVYDEKALKLPAKERDEALLAALGLEDISVIVEASRYTLVELEAIVEKIDKVTANRDTMIYGIRGFGKRIMDNRVEVTLEAPFEENKKAFEENVVRSEAIFFRQSVPEIGDNAEPAILIYEIAEEEAGDPGIEEVFVESETGGDWDRKRVASSLVDAIVKKLLSMV